MKYTHLIKAIDSASQQLQRRAVTAVNQALVIRNWLVGAYIVEFEQQGEDRAKYGTKLLQRLAGDLRKRGLTGLSVQMLERTRQFYLIYPQIGSIISSPVVRKLGFDQEFKALEDFPTTGCRMGQAAVAESISIVASGHKDNFPTSGEEIGKPIGITPLAPHLALRFSWTKILELIRLDDPLKRAFYENECLKGNWSKRQLQRQIGSLLYERTALSKNKEAVIRRGNRQERQETIEDLIRDPYVLEFTGLAQRMEYLESDLEKALLDHLQAFLLELGTGFCFEARQKRITVGNKHDYIDLVFYQRRLRCHVLLDLKIRAFQHGDAGQMNFYLNWWKAHGMEPGDNPPVGIILCSDRDRVEVEFATAGIANRLFVSRYLTALPSEEQLRVFLERDRDQVEALLPPSVPKTTARSKAPGRARRKK
ncbi:MAG: PDDEXK nuclease domain-containing protein [Verrucomicrobiota bacterium]